MWVLASGALQEGALMSRRLDDLQPEMKTLVLKLLNQAEDEGLDLLVTCTRRTLSEQEALYAQGRTTPGKIVTRAKPGQSAHNYGLAVDCVPMIAGKPAWDSKHIAWQHYGNIVRAVGLEWAGDWTTFKEYPHAQVKGFNYRTMIGRQVWQPPV